MFSISLNITPPASYQNTLILSIIYSLFMLSDILFPILMATPLNNYLFDEIGG